MRFGKLELDPAISPAVIDTATWDKEAAIHRVSAIGGGWTGILGSALAGDPHVGAGQGLGGLLAARDGEGQSCLLVRLEDAQSVFLGLGKRGRVDPLGKPMATFDVGPESEARIFAADAETIDQFCRTFKPRNAPRALGPVPRLGIGVRMATRIWPAVYGSMARYGYAANGIQNSVRELNLLEDLKRGYPAERNYAFCFGEIESGYTGSTFEGLWVSGALDALFFDRPLRLGADADHIQMKRSDTGLARALAVIESARYYSFFTLDPSDLLEYGAMSSPDSGETLMNEFVPDPAMRHGLLELHTRVARIAGREYRPSADLVGRLVAKYWRALEGAQLLAGRIAELKGNQPFDLEFAYDENPAGIAVQDCISSDEENLFIAREALRRSLPLTHIAPNFGVEKGNDYRLSDGLPGLGARLSSATQMATEFGLMIDVHSGDDLARATRRVIGKSTKGKLHFKISPSLMYLFAECVWDVQPALFRLWWEDALAYAKREAAGGSQIANECLAALAVSDHPAPSPRHELFHQFYFAFPGRRDQTGRFPNRELIFNQPQEVYAEYQNRVQERLAETMEDVLV